jgi:release factor glutamine methyltransferase
MGTSVRTLADEIAWASASLAEVGIDTARLDAELLMAHLRGGDRARLILDAHVRADGDLRTRYLALVARRAGHEPIAYITAKQGFRHLELAVDPRVLIPRPETELLVEVGLGLPAGTRVVDVGTGSGAIALALKQERPDLEVTGLERSAGALALARHNAARLRLDVAFAVSDLLDDGDYQAVLANLPYIADAEPLPRSVAAFEPAGALYGGPDGLAVIRALCDQLAERPAVVTVALEIGASQGAAVAGLLAAAGFGAVEVRPDLAGLDRVVIGRRTR